MKGPHQRARAHIERANVPRRRVVLLIGGGAEDNQVLEHAAWDAGLLFDCFRIAIQTDSQIHAALDAERGQGLTGRGVELLEHVVGAENQAALFAVLAFPVVHAAAVEAQHPFVTPHLFSRRGVEGHERVVRAAAVDDPAYDERIEVRLAGGVRPGHLQPLDV